jgi:hypothetical protein
MADNGYRLVRDDEDEMALARSNRLVQVCTCGKTRQEHVGGFKGSGEDCGRFTWDGKLYVKVDGDGRD